MKKNYFSLLLAILFVGFTNAQTIYNSTFDETSYDTDEVVADLNNHADWLAGHFNNDNIWTSNADADLVRTGANFAYSLLSGTAITAAVGDVITITTAIRYGNDDQPFNIDETFGDLGGDVNMLVMGLSSTNAPTSADLGQKRDGLQFTIIHTKIMFITITSCIYTIC